MGIPTKTKRAIPAFCWCQLFTVYHFNNNRTCMCGRPNCAWVHGQHPPIFNFSHLQRKTEGSYNKAIICFPAFTKARRAYIFLMTFLQVDQWSWQEGLFSQWFSALTTISVLFLFVLVVWFQFHYAVNLVLVSVTVYHFDFKFFLL